MTGPDFVILGAMKSGTSTLAAQLGAQPGIFMTDPKEPHYFSDDAEYERGPDWYAALFAGASEADVKGEASTSYTKLPTYPETVARARDALQAPRLVYMIRNPVERAVSHFIHEWSQGAMSDDMVAEFANHPEIVEYGRYAMQIRPWIAAFGAEAVHLTSLEAMQADPQGVLEEVAAFIGHDGPVAWDPGRARENVSAARIRKLPFHWLLIDSPPAEWLRRNFIPQSLRDRVKQARQMQERPELPDTLRAALEVSFAEDHADLRALFPNHPRLALSYPFIDP
jgi:hypothetical protein